MLQLQIHSQEIIKLSACYVGRIGRASNKLPIKTFTEQVIFENGWDDPLLLGGWALFSPNNGLLILRVEGSVSFEELDLRLRLTPMGFHACEEF